MSINPKKYIDIDTQDTPIIIYRDKNVVVESLEVNPKSYNQVFEPGEDVDGFAPVTVTAVNSSVDRNIKPENIKQGVSILGVAGEINALVGQEKSVSPTTSQQTVRPDDGYNGLTSVTVRAVNSSIDSAIQAGNIKSGVTILGVSGNVTELNGQEVEITPTTAQQIIEPTDGANGITRATVSAVTASIDSNIQSSNIVDGVSILGVVGNVVELNGTTASVTPTTSAQTITPTSPNNGFTSVSVGAVTSSIDSNIVAENIKNGVSILGVQGNYTGITSKYGISFDAWVGDIDAGGLPSTSGGSGTPTFTGVRTMPNYWLAYKFYGNRNITGNADFSSLQTLAGSSSINYSFTLTEVTSVDMRNLTVISGSSACYHAFDSCRSLTSVNLNSLTTISGTECCSGMFRWCSSLSISELPELTTISGNYACNGMFEACNITSFSFPKLTTITGNMAIEYMFRGCTNLTTLSFPVLSDVGSRTNQFDYMLDNCSNVTVHFPAAMQSTMGSWTSVQNGFGGTNTTVLFDL